MPSILLALLLALPIGAAATGVDAVHGFARARLADTEALLLGPALPALPAVPPADCQALYERRLALMRAELDPAPAFLDEPRHLAAVFIGTMWTPAFYYLPYRAVATTAGHARRGDGAAELEALRRAAAAQRCFER